MSNLEESLIKTNISFNMSDNTWRMTPEKEGLSPISFKADIPAVKRLFRRMKVKDSITAPDSKKGVTYQTMIDDIRTKGNSYIFTWGSRFPSDLEALRTMLKE